MEKKTNKLTWNNFEIKVVYHGDKKAIYLENKNIDNFNHNIITIKNIDTKNKISYSYWSNIENPYIENEIDILKAFLIIIQDTINSEKDYNIFIQNFNYEDNKTSKKIYQHILNNAKKFKKIYLNDIFKLNNEIKEYISNIENHNN